MGGCRMEGRTDGCGTGGQGWPQQLLLLPTPHVPCPQLTVSEPRVVDAPSSSQFEVEPVQGRKVSKVVKTTVVRGARVEKRTGHRSLAADLPSAGDDFQEVSVSAGQQGPEPILPECRREERPPRVAPSPWDLTT